MTLTDTFKRPIRDLRISVTDRCNMRCPHCMPKEAFGPHHQFLPRADVLSFEEIERLVRIFVGLGVEKVRLTGGEPLLRREITELVSKLVSIEGLEDVCLTTNGVLAARKDSDGRTLAKQLKEVGLKRITVSVDSLDDSTFRSMTDSPYGVEEVLQGIQAIKAAGFPPIKVNMVVRAGINDGDVVQMASWARDEGHVLRFIELMDVGTSNGWRMDQVVSGKTIHKQISKEWEVEAVESAYAGEVAKRYRYADGKGEFGLITSVTQPFCGGCTRARVAADGKFYTCLFGSQGFDLRELVRATLSDKDLGDAIAAVWEKRADRYSELRAQKTSSLPKIEMSYIGG